MANKQTDQTYKPWYKNLYFFVFGLNLPDDMTDGMRKIMIKSISSISSPKRYLFSSTAWWNMRNRSLHPGRHASYYYFRHHGGIT